MRFKLFTIIVLLTASFFTNAQNTQELARELILKSVSKYKSYNTAFFKFDYILENRAEEMKETQSGNVYLSDGKFRLTIGEQLIVSDKKKVWTYMREANEVQISDYDPDELEINPSEIFTMWEKGYIYRVLEDVTFKNKNCRLIELSPENKNLSYYKVKLLIETASGDIHKIQTYYKNSGLILTFVINSVVKNPKISTNYFVFDPKKYDGITIVDLSED
jgi:outer membrane lipoprotein carrier protein